jgi:hypothetical protein
VKLFQTTIPATTVNSFDVSEFLAENIQAIGIFEFAQKCMHARNPPQFEIIADVKPLGLRVGVKVPLFRHSAKSPHPREQSMS